LLEANITDKLANKSKTIRLEKVCEESVVIARAAIDYMPPSFPFRIRSWKRFHVFFEKALTLITRHCSLNQGWGAGVGAPGAA